MERLHILTVGGEGKGGGAGAPSREAVLARGAEELEVLAPVVHQAVLLVVAHLARVVRCEFARAPRQLGPVARVQPQSLLVHLHEGANAAHGRLTAHSQTVAENVTQPIE